MFLLSQKMFKRASKEQETRFGEMTLRRFPEDVVSI
jgi:hypothetical protein